MVSKNSQEFVPIKEVRDGTVVLKDGSLRGILMTSTLNFALKSEDEQKSIIFQFQNFLNSLDFEVQIHVQSRKLNIEPYLDTIREKMKSQTNDLMLLQTREYVNFVKKFTESVNIMTKSFFIIVPYTPSVISRKGSKIPFFSSNKNQDGTDFDQFEINKNQLDQRMSIVKQGITRCGIRASVLGSEEIIELYYKTFNPSDVERPLNIESN